MPIIETIGNLYLLLGFIFLAIIILVFFAGSLEYIWTKVRSEKLALLYTIIDAIFFISLVIWFTEVVKFFE